MNCRSDPKSSPHSVLYRPPGQGRRAFGSLRLGIDPAVSSAVFVTTFTDDFRFLNFLAAGGLLVRAWG